MEPWVKISLFACVFGFLKEIRPSEPFIYDYLIGPWRNVTNDQIEKEVYPVGTYSNMILLVFVFLVTDLSRYKPIIVLLGLSGMTVFAMLLWTTSLFALQVLEVFYGMFMAAEVAYYTYIYAKVDKEHYYKVTSHARAAILAGRAISGVSSQILISTNWMDFKQLNYITFSTVTAATIWGLFLPSVNKSIYFHSSQPPLDANPTPNSTKIKLTENIRHAFTTMSQHFLNAYRNFSVVKWSIWYSLSTCGYVQVENYMQPLYAAIQESDDAAYNGAVEAILTVLGFAAALSAGYLRLDWNRYGGWLLLALSVIQGSLIVIACRTSDIFVCYALYILFGVLYHFGVTIASAEISRHIEADSYGLIFGINSFIALCFNSILTALVATKNIGFALDARDQYVVYGGYHVLIGALYVFVVVRDYRLNIKHN